MKNETAPICPYCGKAAALHMNSEVVYSRDYGPIWLCTCVPGYAYVGCHEGTTKAKGSPANTELRQLRIKTHSAFDDIWLRRHALKSEADPSYTRGMARGGRYKALAQLMGMSREDCHIGMFNIEQCKQAIEICESGALELPTEPVQEVA